MTVTGKTMAENLAGVKFDASQKVMRAHDKALSATGGVVGLRAISRPKAGS